MSELGSPEADTTRTSIASTDDATPVTTDDDEATGNPTDAGSAGRSRFSRGLLGWAVVIVAAAVLAFGLRTFAVQTFYVPSGSMLPTLQIGDRMLVDKVPFLRHSIHRGDIVVFARVPADTDPEHPADLVKRVIGLPGETISSKGDTIYINGKALHEPWLPALVGLCAQVSFGIATTHIPSGHYFVMGDCRGDSSDSRYWGTVPSSYIVGRVFLVFWRHGHPWFHWF